MCEPVRVSGTVKVDDNLPTLLTLLVATCTLSNRTVTVRPALNPVPPIVTLVPTMPDTGDIAIEGIIDNVIVLVYTLSVAVIV